MKKSWEIKKLGEVAKIIYGYTEKAHFEEIGPRFLRITDIHDYGVDWENVPYCKISDIDFEKYKLNEGDIVFARTGATTGKSFLVSNPPRSVFASYLIKVHIHNGALLPEYLYLYFQTEAYWNIINQGISGSTLGGFNATKLSNLQIPLPPLLEQQRIVSILDKAFAAIDKAKANAEQNLKNAKELFESYLQGVFENGKETWEEKQLEEVCVFRNGAAHEQNIDEDGNYILINSKFISAEGEKMKRTNSALSPLFVNEIAFVMSDVPNGKALAKCFLVDKNDTYTLNQRIGAIKSNVFVPEFLVYQFNRNKYLLSFDNGENQTNLRKGDILNCPLWLPKTKNEQQTIVRQLNALRAETQKLEANYKKKIDDLEDLKRSILQKAFSGELREIDMPIESKSKKSIAV